MRMKKHIGVLSNTSTRVAVVFRTVPNEPTNCLVVETDRLQDALQAELTHVLDSKESNETNDLYELLNRRSFNNGTNMLTYLHTNGYIRKVPVDQVLLEPIPGNRVSLALVNEQIDGPLDGATAPSTTVAEAVTEPAPVNAEPGVAEGLLMQAQLLEEEAEKKRQEAYAIDPSLAPKKKGRPELSAEEKAQREVEKKQRRLERDRAKAKERREAKAEQALNDAVAEKIARDAARLEGDAE